MAALAGALCWTLATLLWRRMPERLTATQLNLCKTLLAFLLQVPLLLVMGLLDFALTWAARIMNPATSRRRCFPC